jgi:hypothetical protein
MNFQRFLAAIAVVIVASCSDLSTVLDRQEKNLAIDGVYERQFHTALYFPKRPVQKGCSVRLKMFQQTRAQPNFKNAS